MDVEDFDRVLTWLEPVDRERVEEDAALVAEEPFARTGDFEVDAQRFRNALDAETRTLNDARERRDRAAVALSRYWVLRPGANLPDAMGVSRASWSAIRRRYEDRPVRDYRTAPALLARYAALVVRAERILEIGRAARDALAQEMVDAGMTNTQIATRLGLSQPQVSRRVEWKSKSGMM